MNAQIVWIDWLNGISHTWSQAMLRASWQGGLALLIAGILCALLAHLGGSGRVQSWIWRLGYAKFLICLLGLTPIALPLLYGAAPASEVQITPALIATPSPAPPPISDEPPIAIQSLSTPEIPSTPPPPIIAETPPAELTAESWLFALWSVGVVVCGGRLIRTWRRTRALRRAATLDERTTEITAQLAQLMSVHPPQVLIADQLPSPILIGIRHPAILLPTHVASENHNRLRLILAHELAHLKRHDLAWNSLQALVATLFFFHPLLWLTRRPWSLAAEIACDDLALKTTGASRADYGRTLLEFVQQHRDRSPALLGVGVAESAGNIRRRLLAMGTMTHGSRRHIAALAVLAVLITIFGLIPWRLVAQAAQQESPEAKRLTDATTLLYQAATTNHVGIDKYTTSKAADGASRIELTTVGDTAGVYGMLQSLDTKDAPFQFERLQILGQERSKDSFKLEMILNIGDPRPTQTQYSTRWKDLSILLPVGDQKIWLTQVEIDRDGNWLVNGQCTNENDALALLQELQASKQIAKASLNLQGVQGSNLNQFRIVVTYRDVDVPGPAIPTTTNGAGGPRISPNAQTAARAMTEIYRAALQNRVTIESYRQVRATPTARYYELTATSNSAGLTEWLSELDAKGALARIEDMYVSLLPANDDSFQVSLRLVISDPNPVATQFGTMWQALSQLIPPGGQTVQITQLARSRDNLWNLTGRCTTDADVQGLQKSLSADDRFEKPKVSAQKDEVSGRLIFNAAFAFRGIEASSMGALSPPTTSKSTSVPMSAAQIEATNAALKQAAERSNTTIEATRVLNSQHMVAAARGNAKGVETFLHELEQSRTAFHVADVAIKAIKTGDDVFSVDINVGAPGIGPASIDNSTLWRDVIKLFQQNSQRVWLTSLVSQRSPSDFFLAGQCLAEDDAIALLKALQADVRFGSPTLNMAKDAAAGMIHFSILFKYQPVAGATPAQFPPAALTLPSPTVGPVPSTPPAVEPGARPSLELAAASDARLRDLLAARDSAKLQLENLKNRVGAQSPAVRDAEANIKTLDQAIAEQWQRAAANPLTFPGQIGATIADIRAPMDATVAEIRFKEGATVKKGDVLFQLESHEARTALDLARARLAVAQVQLDNLRARFNAGAGTTVDEVKIAELQIQTEKTLLESKMLDLESLTLAAPFDGILSTIDISPGQAITRGTVMTRLVNNTDLRADFLIPYSALSRISVGQKAVVLVGNDRAEEIPAEITFISPVADTNAGTILIRARITGKTENLKPGMFANIRVETAK